MSHIHHKMYRLHQVFGHNTKTTGEGSWVVLRTSQPILTFVIEIHSGFGQCLSPRALGQHMFFLSTILEGTFIEKLQLLYDLLHDGLSFYVRHITKSLILSNCSLQEILTTHCFNVCSFPISLDWGSNNSPLFLRCKAIVHLVELDLRWPIKC